MRDATFLALALTMGSNAQASDNVILVTLDGVRIQELFSGMDPALLDRTEDSGIYDAEVTRTRYWRETPEERRETLMPHFWKRLAPMGVVLGNKAKGSRVEVKNPHWFSYPGYSEMLTGRPQPDVTSNDIVRYPHRTVLEHAREKLGLPKERVAQIGSWEGFEMAAASREEAFFMNGAYDFVPAGLSTPEMDRIAGLRVRIQQLWEESSNDVLTFELARLYLREHRPRVMWLGLSQSDDWAHARRYDRLLDYLHLADELLMELWEEVQSLDTHRDRTTLLITTDHGRGITPKDWAEHDAGIEGSQEIWIAILGPETPDRGELSNAEPVYQSDLAATLLEILGLDYREFDPEAGPPIAAAFESVSGRRRVSEK
jgi:hypothetical protein